MLCVLCLLMLNTNAQYKLNIQFIDKDKSFDPAPLKLQTNFTDRLTCFGYLNELPKLLGAKGYPTASIDTVGEQVNNVTINLFLGKQYRWVQLQPAGIEKKSHRRKWFCRKKFCRQDPHYAAIAGSSGKGIALL